MCDMRMRRPWRSDGAWRSWLGPGGVDKCVRILRAGNVGCQSHCEGFVAVVQVPFRYRLPHVGFGYEPIRTRADSDTHDFRLNGDAAVPS